MVQDEAERLERISERRLYGHGVNAEMVKYTFEVFSRHFVPGIALELGPAEGLMTDLLASRFKDLTVIEGSGAFVADIKKRHPGVNAVHTLFEEFKTDRTFSNIILGHVLEHVEDPVGLLRKVTSWLAPGGKILCAVPNSRSLHRQAAVIMGVLKTEWSMNAADIQHGHRRVYNPEQFRADFYEAGLKIDHFGGYWMKPVSNSQIEKDWTPDMVRAFFVLGERYPDIAAEIYVVACPSA